MQTFFKSLLATSILCLTACASKSANSDSEVIQVNTPKFNIVGLMATADDQRLEAFFKKATKLAYNADEIDVTATLSLPEIEIERREENLRKLKINTPVKVDNEIHVYNGHVCVLFSFASKNLVDYTKAPWTPRLSVDGSEQKTEVQVSPQMVLDPGKDTSFRIPGALNMSVCSIKKLPQVKKVQIRLLGKSKTALIAFEWQAPWPPLHF